jgi:hypothetical protein
MRVKARDGPRGRSEADCWPRRYALRRQKTPANAPHRRKTGFLDFWIRPQIQRGIYFFLVLEVSDFAAGFSVDFSDDFSAAPSLDFSLAAGPGFFPA